MLYRKEIPVKYTADVCVVGGGPSGIAASVAAARQGADVFLIESQGCFGGAGTSALVPTFVDFTDGVHFLAGGIGKEVYDRCLAENPHGRSGHNLGYQVERLKKQYDDMVAEAGVRFLFFSSMVDVICKDGIVEAVIAASKSGVYAITAKVFIDCTGDGDLCARSGAPYAIGDEDGKVMGSTLCSMWENVDWSRPCGQQDSFLERAFQDNLFTHEDRHLPGIFQTGIRSGGGNIGHIFGVCGTEEADLTRGMIEGRRILPEFIRFYQNYVGGPFSNAQPVATGATLGVRESRRILGDYVLNANDFLTRASFEDEIGRFFYPIDIHIAEATKAAFERFQKEFSATGQYCGENYGIPYRCLTPQTLQNVFVAGRCISTDRPMQASVRVMPCCFITGQAAGVAAALCVKRGQTSREINVRELQDCLIALGAYLPDKKQRSFVRNISSAIS